MKELSVNDMKSLELELLKNVATFCDDNNIRYYLCGGRALYYHPPLPAHHMIKVGIIGGETVSAGELIRLLVNHPDVHLMLVASEEHAGMPVTAVHRGLEGDTDLRFCAALSADEAARNLSAVFICGEPWQARQFVEAVDALPTGEPDDSQRHDEHERDGDGQSFLLHVTFSSPKFCSKLPMSNSTVPGAASNH